VSGNALLLQQSLLGVLLQGCSRLPLGEARIDDVFEQQQRILEHFRRSLVGAGGTGRCY
jgi:hypothetical protein